MIRNYKENHERHYSANSRYSFVNKWYFDENSNNETEHCTML